MRGHPTSEQWQGVACLDRACPDALSVTINAPDNTWPEGSYDMHVALDDVAYACRFQLPQDFPEPNQEIGLIDCAPPSIFATFTPEEECHSTGMDGIATGHCERVAGHWWIDFEAEGMPKRLSVQLERDAEALLDEQRDLEYRPLYPDGPPCQPPCPTTSVALRLP